MSIRMNFAGDIDDTLRDEMVNRRPPVMDCVAIRSRTLTKIVKVANELGVDGERIAQLLGADDPSNPKAKRGHRIETDQTKSELVELLAELEERIDDSWDSDRDLIELGPKTTPQLEELVGEKEAHHAKVYSKARILRIQITFAIEKDLDLAIG